MRPKIAKRRTREGGFTLVEVTIASALLSLEVLAVIAMFAVATRSSGYSRRLTTAVSIAHNLLERARNTPYANLDTLAADAAHAVHFDREMNQVPGGALSAIFARTVDIAANVPVDGVTRVTTTVTWTDGGTIHQTAMTTGVSKY